VQESDLNIKLIVLDRLAALKNDHQKVMQGLIMDLLRALSCPNMDIRKKTLAIALDLVTPANVDEVVLSLKREINRAQDEDDKVGATPPPPGGGHHQSSPSPSPAPTPQLTDKWNFVWW
jgi:coatomer subunit beta